jgi:hypothetical protein
VRLLEVVAEGTATHIALHHFFRGKLSLPAESLHRGLTNISGILLRSSATTQEKQTGKHNGQNEKSFQCFHRTKVKDPGKKAIREEWTWMIEP